MKLSRILKTILLTDFITGLAIAIKEIFKSKDQQKIGYYLGRKLAPLLTKLKKIDIKKFKLKKLKKEHYVPLAIIFGTIIISLAIYLGSTAEYRALKKSCITMILLLRLQLLPV